MKSLEESYADLVNRFVAVEETLRNVKRGKRNVLTPDECWDLANKLSIPSDLYRPTTDVMK